MSASFLSASSDCICHSGANDLLCAAVESVLDRFAAELLGGGSTILPRGCVSVLKESSRKFVSSKCLPVHAACMSFFMDLTVASACLSIALWVSTLYGGSPTARQSPGRLYIYIYM